MGLALSIVAVVLSGLALTHSAAMAMLDRMERFLEGFGRIESDTEDWEERVVSVRRRLETVRSVLRNWGEEELEESVVSMLSQLGPLDARFEDAKRVFDQFYGHMTKLPAGSWVFVVIGPWVMMRVFMLGRVEFVKQARSGREVDRNVTSIEREVDKVEAVVREIAVSRGEAPSR